jgi:hypothetical protein
VQQVGIKYYTCNIVSQNIYNIQFLHWLYEVPHNLFKLHSQKDMASYASTSAKACKIFNSLQSEDVLNLPM